jgi:hypothetical protein
MIIYVINNTKRVMINTQFTISTLQWGLVIACLIAKRRIYIYICIYTCLMLVMWIYEIWYCVTKSTIITSSFLWHPFYCVHLYINTHSYINNIHKYIYRDNLLHYFIHLITVILILAATTVFINMILPKPFALLNNLSSAPPHLWNTVWTTVYIPS